MIGVQEHGSYEVCLSSNVRHFETLCCFVRALGGAVIKHVADKIHVTNQARLRLMNRRQPQALFKCG